MAYTADFQPVNLAQIYGAADQANNQQLQNQVLQLQMKKAQKADDDEAALQSAFSGAISPDGTLDRKTLYANLYKVNPQKALEFQNSFNQQDIATAKNNREIQSAKLADAEKIGTIMKQGATSVLANPTLDNAMYQTQQFGKLTGQDVTNELQNLQQIGDNPDALRKWAAGHALNAEQLLPKTQLQDTGGTSNVLNIDPLTGQPTVVATAAKTSTPDAMMTDARARAEGAANRAVTMRGQNMTDTRAKELQGMLEDGTPSPMIETTAQAIAAGKLAPMTGYALRSPGAQRIMARVMEINPDYSAINYGVQSKAEKDFATGKLGNTVRSFNVSLAHLQTLSELSDALDNGNTQLVNKLGNAYASQTGNAAPTNFNAAKKIVADEIVKAIVGSGGGVADREEASRSIDAANSPAQLKGVINTYKDLMRGQIGGLRDQYKATTGKDDFDSKYVSAAGQKVENAGDMSNPLSVTAPDGKTYTFKSVAQANEFKRQAGIK